MKKLFLLGGVAVASLMLSSCNIFNSVVDADIVKTISEPKFAKFSNSVQFEEFKTQAEKLINDNVKAPLFTINSDDSLTLKESLALDTEGSSFEESSRQFFTGVSTKGNIVTYMHGVNKFDTTANISRIDSETQTYMKNENSSLFDSISFKSEAEENGAHKLSYSDTEYAISSVGDTFKIVYSTGTATQDEYKGKKLYHFDENEKTYKFDESETDYDFKKEVGTDLYDDILRVVYPQDFQINNDDCKYYVDGDILTVVKELKDLPYTVNTYTNGVYNYKYTTQVDTKNLVVRVSETRHGKETAKPEDKQFVTELKTTLYTVSTIKKGNQNLKALNLDNFTLSE